jgi:hypothetical protein
MIFDSRESRKDFSNVSTLQQIRSRRPFNFYCASLTDFCARQPRLLIILIRAKPLVVRKQKPKEMKMKKFTFLTIVFCCAFALYFGAKAWAEAAEEAAARVPLENYLKGHATGDPEYMKKAFHTEGNLIFIRDGKYATRSFAEYIGGMNGKPAADEAQRKRRIESIDVAGNAATGKIILDYPTVKFVDYMTLLKIDGEWKIVNKSFYAEPKPQPTQK